MRIVPLLVAGSLMILHCAAQPVVVTPLHSFSVAPANVRNLVMGSRDGKLYGLSLPPGTTLGKLFTLNRDGTGYEVLYSFTAQEWNGVNYVPATGMQEPSVFQSADGALYGTTATGGSNGAGSVFKINPDGTGYTTLHHFTNTTDGFPANLMQAADGMLYGSGVTIFKLNTNGSGHTTLHKFADSEGLGPLGRLLQGNDGMLYGTTYIAGTNGGYGSVFKINTNGSNFTVLHTFNAPGDGKNPMDGLIFGSDGALYGTTSIGGIGENGTVFKINPDGSGYTNLHRFTGTPDGANPFGKVVQGLGGVLYGTTFAGGKAGQGTLFKINPDGSGYSMLHSFTNNSSTGGKPCVELVAGQFSEDVGVLYGGTYDGTPSKGTIYAVLVNPPLSITPVSGQSGDNQTVVFWPAWALNYKLQSTTNLTSGDWISVTNAVPVTGAQVTSTNPAVFYRLVAP